MLVYIIYYHLDNQPINCLPVRIHSYTKHDWVEYNRLLELVNEMNGENASKIISHNFVPKIAEAMVKNNDDINSHSQQGRILRLEREIYEILKLKDDNPQKKNSKDELNSRILELEMLVNTMTLNQINTKVIPPELDDIFPMSSEKEMDVLNQSDNEIELIDQRIENLENNLNKYRELEKLPEKKEDLNKMNPDEVKKLENELKSIVGDLPLL